jgi:sec-independent protein translocase protein TatA
MHLALVLLVVLLVFGPKKLPELARGVGDAIKELQRTLHGADDREAVSFPVATAAIPSVTSAATAAADTVAAGPPPNLAS